MPLLTETPTRNPKRLLDLANAAISADGLSLLVKIRTIEAEPLDLAIPLAEIGDFISFFVQAANLPGAQEDDHVESHERHSTQTSTGSHTSGSQTHLAVIPVPNIRIAAGRTPDEILFVVQTPACQLAFGLPAQQVSLVERDLTRTLRALSADPQNVN